MLGVVQIQLTFSLLFFDSCVLTFKPLSETLHTFCLLCVRSLTFEITRNYCFRTILTDLGLSFGRNCHVNFEFTGRGYMYIHNLQHVINIIFFASKRIKNDVVKSEN